MKKNKPDKYIKNPLNRMMPNYTVYIMSHIEKALVYVVFFSIGGLVSQIFYGGLFKNEYAENTTATLISNVVVFVIVGFAATKFLIPLYVKSRQGKQSKKLERQFITLLDSLSSSLASGSNIQMSFASAYNDLRSQYSVDDFIVSETKQVVDGMAQNIGAEIILQDFGMRSGNENIINFVDVFTTCQRKGGNMQSVIIRTHESIREKITIKDEIETTLTSNKMQLNVMSIMPIAIVALLKMTNPSFATAFASAAGVITNTVAIGIFVGAYIFGTKIISI